MYFKHNLFIVLWLIASAITVLGVVYFRDCPSASEPHVVTETETSEQ